MSKVNEKLIRSKTQSWMHQVEWWRESKDPLAGKLLSICEKYICHFIYKNIQYYTSDYKKELKKEYKTMVRHILASKYLSIKTKVKYLTFANPIIVFR